MKRTGLMTFAVICALLCCFMAAGCKDGIKKNLTGITVDVSAPALQDAKTIAPEGRKLEISTYTLNGTGPDDSRLDSLESNTGKFTLSNIQCGLWTFESVALNSEGIHLAKGSKSQDIQKSTKTTSIVMNELPGTGRLELSIEVQGDFYLPPNSEAQVIIELFDQRTESRTVYSRPVNRTTVSSAFTREAIHAGSYEISVSLYRDNQIITSAFDAVRIVGSSITSGNISLLVGNTTEVTDAKVESDVSAPIQGIIKVRRKGAECEFKSYLLTFKSARLPEGVTEEDLSFRWYCGGVPVINGNCSTCEVSPEIDSQYTVIVTTSKLGSTGSSTVNLKGLDNSDYQDELPKSVETPSRP